MAFKIYTKTGDKGFTSLANGARVSKSDSYVELYGTCDELNSSLGVALGFYPSNVSGEPVWKIQNLLFELGSELAGFRKKDTNVSIILEEDIQFLEKEIDTMQEVLPELKSFILPGGSKAASFLHVSRTLCRRLERMMVTSKESGGEIFESSLIFVNRLSDYLFVLARYLNFQEGQEDIKWFSRAKAKND